MILIVGTVRIPDNALDAVLPAMRTMLAGSRTEDGCLTYAYSQDVLDPGLIRVTERWRDRAALDAHFQTPHMAEWRAAFKSLGITDRDLTLYAADDGSPI